MNLSSQSFQDSRYRSAVVLQGAAVVLAVALVGFLLSMRENTVRAEGVDEMLRFDAIVLLAAFLTLAFGYLSFRRCKQIYWEAQSRRAAEAALYESEGRLRLALDTARMGTWTWDLRAGHARWSEGNEQLFGLEPNSFQGKEADFFALVHPEDRAFMAAATREILEQKDPLVHEFRVVWPDGSIHWLECRAQVLRDEADKPLQVIGTNIDITERKRAAESLSDQNSELLLLNRVSEISLNAPSVDAAYQEIAEAVSSATHFPTVAIELYDPARGCMVFKGAAGFPRRSSGDTLEVPVEETLSGIVAQTGQVLLETDALSRAEYGNEALRQAQTRTFLCVPMIVSGRVIGTLSFGHEEAVSVEEGFVSQVTHLANHVAINTERVRAEEALRESERRFAQFIEGHPLAVYVMDAEGRPYYANKIAQQLLGKDLDPDIRPDGLADAYQIVVAGTGEKYPTERIPIVRALAGETSTVDDMEIRVSDRVIPLEVTATPIFGTNGTITSAISVFCDITDRRGSEEALRRSNTQLQLALDAAKMGVWDADLESGNSGWSESLERMFGLEPGTFEGGFEAFLSRVHPDDRALFFVDLDGINDFGTEYRGLMPDGSIRHFEGKAQVLRDGTGRPVRLVGTCVDVTERKLAEEERRQNEMQLAQAQQLAHLGSWEWRVADDVVFWSDELYRIYGLEPGSLALSYKVILECVHPNDRDYFQKTIEEAYRTLESYELYYRIIRPDGETRTLHARGVVVADESGQPVRIIGSALDVTEHKRAVSELRQSRAHFLRMASNVPGMVYQFVRHASGELAFPFVSEGCREIYGLEPEEIRANANLIIDIIHPDDREGFNQSVIECGRTHQPWKWEGRVILSSGEQKWLQGAARPDRQEDGHLVWDGLMIDITERKQLQMQLLQSDKLAALGKMVAGVAHEINNPLAIISGCAQLLEMHPDEKVKRRGETVRRMSERATRIVRSMLSFSRDTPSDRRPISLNRIVEEALEMCSYRLQQGDIHLELRLAEPPPVVNVCGNQLEQVIVNLVNNAEHALRAKMSDNKQITITTEGHQESNGTHSARILVEDNGTGIPSEVKGRIFEPFFTTKDVGEGTGLGLSICHGIVQAHGGALVLESEPGEGTVFVLTLPLAEVSELAA